MKVIHITPGLIQIPPNGWGAVEKIIWEFHKELLSKNIQSVSNSPLFLINIFSKFSYSLNKS